MSEQSERQERGLLIAAKTRITQKDGLWQVPSASGYAPFYTVNPDPKAMHCTCPDFEKREAKCKHIYAVEIVVERESSTTTTTDGDLTTTTTTETVKVTKRITYAQDWTAYNQAQTHEKAIFQKLLADLCSNVVEPDYVFGRPRLPYKDMIFAAAFKVYSTVSTRRFMTDLGEAHTKGYISKVPHFNSIFNYLELAALTPVLKAMIHHSSLPLKAIENDFAVDSSGFTTCNYKSWFDQKYGVERQTNQWIKAHLMCGVKTHVVTSVEITDKDANDSPMLPGLVKETAKSFTLNEVSADKGYSGTDNHDAIDKAGAVPYIAFKSNATGEAGGLFEKMFYYYKFRRDEFLAAYHKRSNVETVFHMIKAKFDTHLRSKGDTAQVNEALCKILCHNLCVLIQSMFELGIVPTFCGENAVGGITEPVKA